MSVVEWLSTPAALTTGVWVFAGFAGLVVVGIGIQAVQVAIRLVRARLPSAPAEQRAERP